jgi:hypothetical protein
VTGVWAGNSDNSPMYNILSTSISYRAVRDFMEQALVDTPVSQFPKPDGLVTADVCEPSGMKPTPSCGRVIKNLLPADKAPTQDDTWWSTAKVDIRTGLLATELTPSQFVQQRSGLAIPDSVQGFARTQAEEWARVLGAGSAPTQKSDESNIPVGIVNPADGSTVRGIVPVAGKADSPDFVSYSVQFGEGDPPVAWTTIMQSTTPQPAGGLANWNTAGLPDGTYTLRIVVEDAKLGELSSFVVVTIGAQAGNGNGNGNGNVRHSPTSTPAADPFATAVAGDDGKPGHGH